MITKKALKEYSKQKFKYDRKTSIEVWFIRYLCNRFFSDEIASHLRDISTLGCSSGCVGELIYNSDIVKFYAKYEEQIWNIIQEYIDSTGQTLPQFLEGFNAELEDNVIFKVYLTWFAVEYLAYQLLNQFSKN